MDMADPYGWIDERRHRPPHEEERARREARDDGRRFGPSQGSRPEEVNDDYARPAERGSYGRDYADDYRPDPARDQPYSHARYLRERDERDERRAGEHRGRGPSDYVRSDERIHEDVNEHLAEDGWLDASDIRVKVQKGEVTLGGLVGSRLDKRRAERICDAVFGVKHTQNNLRVRDSSMAKPGDEHFKEDKAQREQREQGEDPTRTN
jgi:hypothetical protein